MVSHRDEKTESGKIPDQLAQIPEDYFTPAEEQGSLGRLTYKTYESMSYESQEKRLDKTAYVYLPYGYSKEKKYNVFYLMHGGWSDETTYLGTPENPNVLVNVIDHAIQDGELVNDLIPAVEGAYSTYAEGTSMEELKVSRSHRAFAGFSMGSVATWHTFQYCLDYFRYFLPSSGNLSSDGAYMESLVTDSGHRPDDFFIYAMSGTEDFAYAGFSSHIEAMLQAPNGIFTAAKTESEGNLAFRVQEGNSHDGEAAMQYIYNGLIWIWKS